MSTEIQAFAPSHSSCRPIPRRARTWLPYGLRQEEELRRGLGGDGRLVVHYSREVDTIYKLDAVVVDRNAPTLPAVGVQFTTKHDPDKEYRTMAAVRNSRVVARLLYLEAECSLDDAAIRMVRDLVLFTARRPPERGLVSAILARNEKGHYWRQMKDAPLETIDRPYTQKEEKEVEKDEIPSTSVDPGDSRSSVAFLCGAAGC